jgi:RNA polymerase sigma-70 factor (ECF subfamily)
MNALVRAFQEEVGSASARAPGDGAALEKLLASFYARGREAYPRIALDEQAFGRHLARCAKEAKASSLADLPAPDIYLACACAARVRGAATAFERKFGPIIRRAISRVLKSADERQEAEQRAWDHIVVEGARGAPRITHYLGQGPLENWVSVAAMRIAVSFGRAESAERRLRAKVVSDTSRIDAEGMSMKGQLREAFEAAVAEALGGLKARERLILKLHVVSGMTLEAISKSLGVSRQAVSKTFSRTREGILGSVEASLRRRLKISRGELSSVLRLVASQLDVSVSRILGNA